MANTKKPQQNNFSVSPCNAPLQADLEAAQSLYPQFIQTAQSYIHANNTVLVGLSGGLDSCVLLHLLVQWRHTLGFTLNAMHVHHGISQHADAWLRFCETLCHEYHVGLSAQYVKLNKKSGLGLEAEARLLRYQALLGTDADVVCVAHHEDDQAETLLLQMLRGAGVKGLAGMAAFNADKRLLRPLLNIRRATLEHYAKAHGLQWIEDESNAVQRFDRNFIRHSVMPLLNSRYPTTQSTLARAATHLAEAYALTNELAQIDATDCIASSRLCIAPFQLLSNIRQKNLLRWWFSQQQLVMPSTAKLDVILQQLVNAKADANLKVLLDKQSGLVLRRYQGVAYVSQEQIAPANNNLQWQGEESLSLPDGSKLIFSYELGQGLDTVKLNGKLNIRYRVGGERFKPHAKRPKRTLKHLLQEANIAPSVREQLPLIYADSTLVLVPMIGIEADYQVATDYQGLVITWQHEKLLFTQ